MQISNLPQQRSRLVIFLALSVAVIGIYNLYSDTKFHIVSTNPKTSSVATISPFLKINFNKQLSQNGLVVTSNPSVVKSYVVTGKTLLINLNTPMMVDKKYSIIVNKITDVSNGVITNKAFVFSPRIIPAQKLPRDQAAVLLQQQTYHPPSRNNIGFLDTSSLVKYGVSLTQIDDFKQAIFEYSPSSKVVAIDPASVKPVPHNPSSASKSDSIDFSLTIDAKPYAAHIEYSGLTTLRLFLYDSQGGSLKYDSKDVDLSSSQ